MAVSVLLKPRHLHNESSVNFKGRYAMSVGSECVNNSKCIVHIVHFDVFCWLGNWLDVFYGRNGHTGAITTDKPDPEECERCCDESLQRGRHGGEGDHRIRTLQVQELVRPLTLNKLQCKFGLWAKPVSKIVDLVRFGKMEIVDILHLVMICFVGD
jgi:hypothetical protein